MIKTWQCIGLMAVFTTGLTSCDESGAAPVTDTGTSVLAVQANLPGKANHSIVVDGMERRFIAYVPTLAHGRRVPVVYMLHGTSGSGEKFYRISGWREKADQEGFIAVFPTALTYCYKDDQNRDGDFDDPHETLVTTKWANGRLGEAAMPLCSQAELNQLPPRFFRKANHPLMDDVAFIRGSLDFLDSHYRIDADRVYVSGFSNGSGMAHRLAVEMSDRFAAASGSAGSTSVFTMAEHPISFVATVGALDPGISDLLNVASIPLAATLFDDVPPLKQLAVDPMLAMLQIDDVYEHRQLIKAGTLISQFRFADSLTGAGNEYQFVVIDGLEHQYPNGSNHPLVLADFLWNFFSKYSLH